MYEFFNNDGRVIDTVMVLPTTIVDAYLEYSLADVNKISKEVKINNNEFLHQI